MRITQTRENFEKKKETIMQKTKNEKVLNKKGNRQASF